MADAVSLPALEPASDTLPAAAAEPVAPVVVGPANVGNRSADEITRAYVEARKKQGKIAPTKPAGSAPPPQDDNTVKYGRRAPAAFNSAPKVQETYKKRVYAPGPGAYEPGFNHRFGSMKRETWSFGGSDRSYIENCISQSHSPGPRYIPNTSPKETASPSFSFGRAGKYATPPHNGPYGNPGPGEYPTGNDRCGDQNYSSCPGFVFGTSSHVNPHQSFPKTVFLSAKHEYENHGIHSPGPQYHPGDGLQVKHLSYTMRPKLGMSFDQEKVAALVSPGPGKYSPRKVRTGDTLGAQRTVPFSKSVQRQRPEENLNKTVFISEVHSLSENCGVLSPGPCKYTPKPKQFNKMSPIMKFQGHADRFYSPFESGRLH